MTHWRWWQTLWALAIVSSLAPPPEDGNIGCLFSISLCNSEELCYDDSAFGKCIPLYEEKQEDSVLYKYNMSNDELKWLETALQQLVARGYLWGHAYTQCVLQAMLYTIRENIDISQVNTDICDNYAETSLSSEPGGNANEDPEAEEDETAFVRFTPNSLLSESDFANEVYNPPLEEIPNEYLIVKEAPYNEQHLVDDTSADNMRDLMLSRDNEDPIITPFEGFRERLQTEQQGKAESGLMDDFNDIEKKSILQIGALDDDNINIDEPNYEERLGAHYRKHKNRVPPFTAEYITGNRDTLLDDEVLSALAAKYKESLAAKTFPFEYENPDNELPERRIYLEDDFNLGPGEELDINNSKGPLKQKSTKGRQYLMNLFNMMDSKNSDPLYAEGGPIRADDLKGDKSKFSSEDIQGFLYNELGFKRRERDDVKKPGPRLNANVIKTFFENVTESDTKGKLMQQISPGSHPLHKFEHDPSYAYVMFKNRFGTDWNKGIKFISKLEELMGLENNTFTNPRVAPAEVTFKVEKNSQGLDAKDVAMRVGQYSNELQRQTGALVDTSGVGDKVKLPIARRTTDDEGALFLGMELPILLALVGSLAVLLVASAIFALLLRRDMRTKGKLHGLASAADIDSEASRDYQELCRDRMSGKWIGQQTTSAHPAETPQRITSLSREPDGNSPSTRSSTSSWSEEPALTNMDISTGHMVLNYMEDHLHKKDRLEQEWQALCAYEAEPCLAVAATKPENIDKNRYTDVLPYDHSRVTLNTLTNHLGSDYINASSISDHDPRNPAYIAAAGPLANTAPDFWQMVWEQGSVVMVMLTRLTENGQQLCHRYWPEEGSDLYHIYEVHLVSEHIWCDDYLVRSFYLKNQRTGETRTVTQFHFLSWPENGVPNSSKALLEFRRKVNKSYRGRSCPIVVHCSDGAGRTGTYCLIDMVLNRMAKGAKEIDIAATLEHIRDQRPRTVATRQQFEFVLTAVAAEVHAILKAHTAHMQQMQEKKDKDKDKEGAEKEKP